VLALSITESENFQMPTVASVPVETVETEDVVQAKDFPRVLLALAAGANWSHWQVYVEVPPLSEVAMERVEF
jgi:hypothetical protein